MSDQNQETIVEEGEVANRLTLEELTRPLWREYQEANRSDSGSRSRNRMEALKTVQEKIVVVVTTFHNFIDSQKETVPLPGKEETGAKKGK